MTLVPVDQLNSPISETASLPLASFSRKASTLEVVLINQHIANPKNMVTHRL